MPLFWRIFGMFKPTQSSNIMKIKVILSVLVIVGLSSCAYKSCPTYSKNIKKVEQKHAPTKF